METFATLKMNLSPDDSQRFIGSEGQQEESSSCPRTALTFLSTDGSSPIVHLPKAVDNASFDAQLRQQFSLPRQNQQAPPPTHNQEQMVEALSFPQAPAIQVHGPPPPSEIRPTVRAQVVFARPISNQVICRPSDNMVGAPVNFACPVSNQVHPSPPPPEKFVGARIKI